MPKPSLDFVRLFLRPWFSQLSRLRPLLQPWTLSIIYPGFSSAYLYFHTSVLITKKSFLTGSHPLNLTNYSLSPIKNVKDFTKQEKGFMNIGLEVEENGFLVASRDQSFPTSQDSPDIELERTTVSHPSWANFNPCQFDTFSSFSSDPFFNFSKNNVWPTFKAHWFIFSKATLLFPIRTFWILSNLLWSTSTLSKCACCSFFNSQNWVFRSEYFFQFLVEILHLGSGSVDPHNFADSNPGSQIVADPDPKH